MKKKNLLLMLLLIVNLFVLGVCLKYNQNLISSSEVSAAQTYIGNINTKKMHYPDCYCARKMKETNKIYLNCTRDEAISKGYSPCGNCAP